MESRENFRTLPGLSRVAFSQWLANIVLEYVLSQFQGECYKMIFHEYQRKCKDVDGLMFGTSAQFLLERCQSRLKCRDMDLKKGSHRDMTR